MQSLNQRLGGYGGAQIGVMLAVALFALMLISNTSANLEQQNIAYGFGFLTERTGFQVSQSLIDYDESSSYVRLLGVAVINTLVVAALGIVVASVLGVVLGIMRLSQNWLVARVAAAYVETLRNVPLLLQILFWYSGVLAALPRPRESLQLLPSVFLSNRGLVFPILELQAGAWVWFVAVAVFVGSALGLQMRRHRERRRFGRARPMGLRLLAIFIVLAGASGLSVGWPFVASFPVFRGFNFVGGARLIPEFVALVLALGLYTAAFIAEIVRAGIEAVSVGQKEAAQSLGLSPAQGLRFIVLPQALRVIIPPLTSQYLNLTKNSSLGAAIAYPELVAVFAGTALAQVGQAVEIIGITMGIYLVISLLTALAMNRYNRLQLQRGAAG